VVGRAVGEGAVGGDVEFLALRGDIWEVDWFGFVREFLVVEGVTGFPGVWGEGVMGLGGGYVVEDDGLGGVVGGTHYGCLLWRWRWLFCSGLGCWVKRIGAVLRGFVFELVELQGSCREWVLALGKHRLHESS